METHSPALCVTTLPRWVRFNLVGLAGVVVQVVALVTLADGFAVNLRIATITAVLAALAHNFVWHVRWTWADRPSGSVAATFVRFTMANGFISLVGNAVLVSMLIDAAGVPTVAASLIAIGACSLLNYALADRLVFSSAIRRGTDRAVLTLPSPPLTGNHGGRRPCPSKARLPKLEPSCWSPRRSDSSGPGCASH
jgi:putative flippase GtrA